MTAAVSEPPSAVFPPIFWERNCSAIAAASSGRLAADAPAPIANDANKMY
jgi:hypothetical protein